MPGTVYLVGAGPGDPGLMTRRALDLIASADVVLYDRLIPPGALDGARADAELRYVGKQPGGHSHSQEEINALRPELDGNQIMELLGIPPGRDVGRAYRYLLERRIDAGPLGPDRAREELLAWWAAQS